MPKMNVMDAVVRVMESEGTDVVFGVPGAAILPLYEALAKSTKIRHLSVRHEEGGTHSADGYARVTGRVGVDIVEIAKPVTKWAVQVKETAQLPWVFRQAYRIAQEGRPGPVLIDLPLNVQKGPEVDWDPDWDRALAFERPQPNPAAIREAVAMLLQAERPMIMPGGGVILADAAPALMALA